MIDNQGHPGTDPGPPAPAEITLRWQHTTCRSAKLNAAGIREIFGLGGTPADVLIDRLVALLAARPSLLGCDAIESIASWELDTAHTLTHIDGQSPGDAAEYLTIAETGQIVSPPWQAEPDGREHDRCGEDCSAHGQWAATGIMPSGHMWQWSDQAHTSGYLAHRTRP